MTSAATAQEQSLRRASELAARGDHGAAVRVLREAQVEAPSARVDVNLALTLGELGQLREARRLLRRVAESDANPLLVEVAVEHLREVETALPVLTVRVDGGATELRVDAERVIPIAARTLEVELDPGEHEIELLGQDGEAVERATVALARGERTTVRIGRPARSLARGDAHGRDPRSSRRPPSPEDAAEAAVAPPAAAVDLTATAEPATDEDPLPWVLAGSGAAVAVIATVVAVAVVASQPAGTMGDLSPVVVGGP